MASCAQKSSPVKATAISTIDQRQTPIFDAIKRTAATRMVSFQTPGHTGGKSMPDELKSLLGAQLFQMDVSVCADIDSLSQPHTFIREAETLLARAYGVKQSFFIVNGSTTGNLAMLMTALHEGDKLILPRYVHRSILHALSLTRAEPIWIANEYDPVYKIPYPLTSAQVTQALNEHPDAKAVLINTPTYHGLCCDIRHIASIVHDAGKLLLVDEAWGAHLPFHADFPESGVQYADLCVHSLHKMLPVTNQGAVLHCNSSAIDIDYLTYILTFFQTTSPSYVLLSIMDVIRREMALHGREYFDEVLDVATYARQRINSVPGLSCVTDTVLPQHVTLDPAKVTINIDPRFFNMSGYDLEIQLCQQFQIQIEMAGPTYILILIKPGVSRLDIDYLLTSLAKLQKSCPPCTSKRPSPVIPPFSQWDTIINPSQAFSTEHRLMPLNESVGMVCWGAVYAYPPGTPILVPGERISQTVVDYINDLQEFGAEIKGLTEEMEVPVCESLLTLVTT